MRDDELRELVGAVRGTALPLTDTTADFDPIIELARDRRFVLIGEASHGTHEFYRTRALITRRLIEELGFTAVAAEADWPDAYRVNRWVRGEGEDRDAVEALDGFRRFPQWMWRNTDVVDFVSWLHAHNLRASDPSRQAGFYGLDLYSLHASIEAVLAYLHEVDPDAARRAAYRYACFDQFGEDPQAYGYAAAFDLSASCEAEAVNQLVELRTAAAKYARRDGSASAEALFFAEQNARVVLNAEEYYRAMFRGRSSSWNLRDQHMKETLDELVAHLKVSGVPPRLVVWAHNSHLGDARATEMSLRGELNLGQLVRESYGDEALLVGFTTFAGTVTAARDWDEPAEQKRVRDALPDSYEWLLHEALEADALIPLRGPGTEHARALLEPARLERAIGVIYRPESERVSHYFHAALSRQFDVVLHHDRTRAIRPLEYTPAWSAGEVPETYPSAL